MLRDAVHPILHLTRFEARTARAAKDDSDASLLSAYRTDVVPLLGRDAVQIVYGPPPASPGTTFSADGR
jgi:hypothetical protein